MKNSGERLGISRASAQNRHCQPAKGSLPQATRYQGRALGWFVFVTMVAVAAQVSTFAQTVPAAISLADAQRMIASAVQKASEQEKRVGVAVVDGRGDLIAMERMPGARFARFCPGVFCTGLDLVRGMAMVSAAFGVPSREMMKAAGSFTGSSALGASLENAVGGRFFFAQGGVPVVRSGVVIGALAIGGGGGPVNEPISQAVVADYLGHPVPPAGSRVQEERPQAGTPPPAPPPGPSIPEARRLMAAALAAAAGMRVTLSCVVADTRGDPVAVARMDGARFFTTDIARDKAASAAILKQPSGGNLGGEIPEIVRAALADVGARPFPARGGVPLMRNGLPYGAIGCSGATAQQDEDAANAGERALDAK